MTWSGFLKNPLKILALQILSFPRFCTGWLISMTSSDDSSYREYVDMYVFRVGVLGDRWGEVVCREIKGWGSDKYVYTCTYTYISYKKGPRGSNPAFFVSREALHDEEPDQIEGNYIVVGHPVPLWQPKYQWVIYMSHNDLWHLPGCHICNNNLEQKKL